MRTRKTAAFSPLHDNSSKLLARFLAVAGLLFVCFGCRPRPPDHGIALVVALETNQLKDTVAVTEHLQRTEEVLRRRLRRIGYGYSVERDLGETLVVKLPHLADDEMASARRLISTLGLLEFRLVHPESANLTAHDVGEPGYDVMTLTNEFASNKHLEKLLISRKPEQGLTGKYIQRAYVSRDPITNQPQILFELDNEGAALFARVTKANIGQRLAIVLDGVLRSAPVIQGEIPQGRGVISGQFTVSEALELATLLENPLEVPHRIIGEKSF